MKHNLIKEELKIIENDKILNTLDISSEIVYNRALQEDVEIITVKKEIYKRQNEVFNRNDRAKSTLKCEFTLHTRRKSSFVKVIGLNDEVIYEGNYLHSNASDKSYKSHLATISIFHDLNSIKENY